MAELDPDYDIRDRVRMIDTMLSGAIPDYLVSSKMPPVDESEPRVVLRLEQVKLVLFNGRPPVTNEEAMKTGEKISLTSA